MMLLAEQQQPTASEAPSSQTIANVNYLYRDDNIVLAWEKTIKREHPNAAFYINESRTVSSLFHDTQQTYVSGLILKQDVSPLFVAGSAVILGQGITDFDQQLEFFDPMFRSIVDACSVLVDYQKNKTGNSQKITTATLMLPLRHGPNHYNLVTITLQLAGECITHVSFTSYEPLKDNFTLGESFQLLLQIMLFPYSQKANRQAAKLVNSLA